MRIPVIAGNWKMNLLTGPAVELVTQLRERLRDAGGAETIVCPPFTAIAPVVDALEGSTIAVAGQNCYLKSSGAYTGEVSPEMLLDAGCRWVIIGHSERRQYFGETDDTLNQKLKLALETGLRVMFCIGETLEERESGEMDAVLRRQVENGLAGLNTADFERVVIAYEPVWAIGTGVTATPQQAQEAHAYVRGLIRSGFGGGVASTLRIQYGGSVKPDNAAELLEQADVDGALVGGASLDAKSFASIVRAAS